jgi:hypothetical protein
MRDFANTSIRFNKRMNDENKLPLGIHPADTTTMHLPPTSQPDTVVNNTVNHFEHRVWPCFEQVVAVFRGQGRRIRASNWALMAVSSAVMTASGMA